MTRAVVDHPGNVSLSGSMMSQWNTSQIPRSNTFASKAMPSGAMSPTVSGQGLGFNQRCSSFTTGATPGGYPGQQHSSVAYPSMMGSQRSSSPIRPNPNPHASASPYGGHSLQAPMPLQQHPRAPASACGMTSPVPAHQQGQHPLEMSQRLARATELQSRLSSGGGPGQPPQQTPQPLPFPIGTPSLLNWAKEHQQSRFNGMTGNGPSGPGGFGSSGPSGHGDGGDPMGLGLSTLHNLPPPPRSAPAAEAGRSGPVGGGAAAREREPEHSLTVLTSDNRWETINFTASDNLELKGGSFLKQKGLKAAFQSGLTSKMRTMIATGQAQSSVDIVDLI